MLLVNIGIIIKNFKIKMKICDKLLNTYLKRSL